MMRFPPRRILVAADRSGPAAAALDAAQALALRWSCALEIVYAAPAPELVAGPNAVLALAAAPEAWREVEARLRAAAAGFPSGRLSVRTVHGWPPAALAGAGAARGAPTFWSSARTATRAWTGSSRLRCSGPSVSRRADPVLPSPARGRLARPARVLAPSNGRPYATRALRWARDWARIWARRWT